MSTFILGLSCGAVLYGLSLLLRTFFRVEEGHLAVLTSLGAAVVDEAQPDRLRTYGAGLHRKRPWERVHDVPMMEQRLDLSGEEGGQTAMTADGTVLRFDSIVRYVPVQTELRSFLFGLREPLPHITGLFTCLLRNEIANFRSPDVVLPNGEPLSDSSSYALIRRARRALNDRIEQFSRLRIGHRYGVQFNGVDLTDVLPPDELANALNAVIQAQHEAEAQLSRAQAECEQQVLAANRGVEIAHARARAVEVEIETLGAFLEQLDNANTLEMYVARRLVEVSSEARTLYFKEGGR